MSWKCQDLYSCSQLNSQLTGKLFFFKSQLAEFYNKDSQMNILADLRGQFI